MNYIKVQRMAKYYLIALEIVEYGYSLLMLCQKHDCKSLSGFERFLNLYLKKEEPGLYEKVKSVLEKHRWQADMRLTEPTDQLFLDFLKECEYDEDRMLIVIGRHIMKWTYYDDKPFAIEKYKKEMGFYE